MGAAMGFRPKDIDEMTLWEFSACVGGWSMSKGIKKPGKKISDSDYDALEALGEKWNQEARNG